MRKPCLDFAYVGLTKAAIAEDCNLGKLKLICTVRIPPKFGAILRCSLQSKTTGLSAQICVEIELEGLDDYLPFNSLH